MERSPASSFLESGLVHVHFQCEPLQVGGAIKGSIYVHTYVGRGVLVAQVVTDTVIYLGYLNTVLRTSVIHVQYKEGNETCRRWDGHEAPAQIQAPKVQARLDPDSTLQDAPDAPVCSSQCRPRASIHHRRAASVGRDEAADADL